VRRYRLWIREKVKKQITDQVEYIARDSIENALKWEERLRVAFEKIAENPRYAVDEEATRRVGMETRKVVFERTYLIFFVVIEETRTVELIGFRHGYRSPAPGTP
jgi:plasmid stabilization system protein ParE